MIILRVLPCGYSRWKTMVRAYLRRSVSACSNRFIACDHVRREAGSASTWCSKSLSGTMAACRSLALPGGGTIVRVEFGPHEQLGAREPTFPHL